MTDVYCETRAVNEATTGGSGQAVRPAAVSSAGLRIRLTRLHLAAPSARSIGGLALMTSGEAGGSRYVADPQGV